MREEESVIAWQRCRARQIEAELNRGSGSMWRTPFYVSPDRGVGMFDRAYRPKPLTEKRDYRWKKKPKKESLKFDLLMNGGVRKYPDGREVCQDNQAGRVEYKRRVNVMLQRQNFKCCLCSDPINSYNATFEHRCPRGMAGARRDDRIEDENGLPMNGAAHWQCNVEKGSKRI